MWSARSLQLLCLAAHFRLFSAFNLSHCSLQALYLLHPTVSLQLLTFRTALLSFISSSSHHETKLSVHLTNTLPRKMPPKRKLSASEASSSAGPTKKARSANVPTEPFHMSTRRRAKSAAPVAADEVATAEVEGGVVEERGVGEGVGEVAGAILAPVVEEEEGAGEGGGEVEEAVVEAAVEEEVGVGEGGDGVEVGGVEGDPGSVELAPSGPVTRGRGRGRGLAAPAAPATLAPTIRKRRGAYKAPKDNPVAVKLSARIDELNAVFRGVAKATKLVDDEIGKRTHEQLVTNPTLHEQLPQFGKLMEEMGVRWKAKRQAITAKYKLEVEQLKRRAEAEKHVINDMYEVCITHPNP